MLGTIGAVLGVLGATLLVLRYLVDHHRVWALLWHVQFSEWLRDQLSGLSRPQRILHHVHRSATLGDPQSVIAAVDNYCRHVEWAMNVGDKKGEATAGATLGVPRWARRESGNPLSTQNWEGNWGEEGRGVGGGEVPGAAATCQGKPHQGFTPPLRADPGQGGGRDETPHRAGAGHLLWLLRYPHWATSGPRGTAHHHGGEPCLRHRRQEDDYFRWIGRQDRGDGGLYLRPHSPTEGEMWLGHAGPRVP
uniref:Uncharacterized protein n=1 Tax=Ornithorhynchus anatinus TaxID=9258 RepID=A0A6I8NRR5_ORNAN